MNVKSVIAAVAAASSLTAHAVGPGALGDIDNTPVVIGNTVPAGLLFDVYSFSLLDPGALSGIASALNVPPALNLSPFSVVLQDSFFTVIGTDSDPGDGFSFGGLSAGSYALSFVGFATGALGGSYGGVILAETTPVPEPAGYALMLAGLAGLGFVMRRRLGR